MKHILSYSLIASLVLFYSCSGSDANENNPIIDVESALGTGKIHNASEFIKEIKYVPLETSSSSMVGNIRKVFVEGGKIYVWDDKSIINIFSITGRHLNTLNRVGRGPEEYANMSDFIIAENGNIFILSQNKEIIEYDNSLKFIRKTEFGSDARYLDFISLGNGLFASNIIEFSMESRSSEERWTVYDYHDSLKTRFSYSSEATTRTAGGTGIDQAPIFYIRLNPYKQYKHNNDLNIYKRGNDTIFNIDIENDYSKSARYIFNYGKYVFLEEMESGINSAPADLKAISLTSLLESNDYLFLEFNFRGLSPEPFEIESDYMVVNGTRITTQEGRNTDVYAIYHKKRREIILLNQSSPRTLGLKDDVTDGVVFWPKHITTKQELVTWHDAYELIFLAEEGKIDKSLVANLQEDDNPVIVIATPK